ncbi:receptor protein-tyrosine kinase [Aeromicrobium panaciterrae]|uniref:Receptor protein-tyrosine kinase n=1 Tax=Aeromicrobium panaciterrae TaxID=363861 RepID=A0ABU1UL75_9ACTN|nr:polysaccharide biosynthesis tyrosine autokinase [Aeromicrobium panaciterrae]MDR7085921.1 receptor protein-tyrosine kinase [Aeromicrobium panaciterrae]
MGLIQYLRIARRRWITIAVVLLICTGAAAFLTSRATPMYASSARLFVSTQESDSNSAYSGNLLSQSRVKSYADLLTGEEISRRVVQKLNLNESPRALASQITAFARLDTVVLSISVTDADPDRAQLLTQTIAEVFVGYVKELETPDGKSAAPVKATIVDRATTPDQPISPQPIRNLIVATMLGLLLGVALAAIRDVLDQSTTTPEELATRTGGAPLLGNVHYDRGAGKRPLISALDTHSPRAESYRVLRTNLQFVKLGGASKVFVVTSAVPGEGKSTTTINLALSLAESGKRVLLLEADLRRPRVMTYLGIEGAVGLTTVLVGEVEWQEAVQQSHGVDVITSGTIPPNPTDLLQSPELRELLVQLRRSYDIVLIDAPPLLPVADAAVLAPVTDGAILVVRHGSTTRGQVSGAVERLRSVGARLAGTVFNMTPVSRRGREGYGYGYGYAPDQLTRATTESSEADAEASLSRKQRRAARKADKAAAKAEAEPGLSRKERRASHKASASDETDVLESEPVSAELGHHSKAGGANQLAGDVDDRRSERD